jgi:heme exporter protein C
MAVALYLAFGYAPLEAEQGIVQKIFYVHVPLAWNAFLGFFLVFIFSFRYLMSRERRFDIRAQAAAEVGVVFTSLVLITGPIWAKPIWGIWWTWDARLTLTLVLWLIYVGYLMLRHYVENPDKRSTLAAVVGIIGFIDVPLVYFAIRWWRTQHPQPVIAGGEESGLDPRMATALWVCVFAFTTLFLYLYRRRVQLEEMREAAADREERRDALATGGAS